jgi:hypothetical protein
MATATRGAPPIPGPRPLPVLGARGNFIRFLADPITYMMRVYRPWPADIHDSWRSAPGAGVRAGVQPPAAE